MSRMSRMSRMKARAAIIAAIALGACGAPQEPPTPDVRPVRTSTVEEVTGGEIVRLTGQIVAEEEVSLAFRVGQRMVERTVGLGDRVVPGQRIARLESTTFENALQEARANLTGTNAQLAETQLEFDRQRAMFDRGVASRAAFERARAARDTVSAQVDAARAQLDTAREHLTFTELHADSGGVVIAVGAEPGEVVGAGQMIVRLARQGGRDAVFEVPARVKESAVGLDPEVIVMLASNPSVRATGRVREVSPQANPVTRTFQVKVGLIDPPDAMRLGSAVTGMTKIGYGSGLSIPASALTAAEGGPAVFVFDPDSGTVSLRPVKVESFGVADLIVAEGLVPEDIVVTAGVQTLRPGQKVRLLQGAP
jgi:RND family efflux transporter MFP subunit